MWQFLSRNASVRTTVCPHDSIIPFSYLLLYHKNKKKRKKKEKRKKTFIEPTRSSNHSMMQES